MNVQSNFQNLIISIFFVSLTHCFGSPKEELPPNNPDGGTTGSDSSIIHYDAQRTDAEKQPSDSGSDSASNACKQTVCNVEFKLCKNPTCDKPNPSECSTPCEDGYKSCQKTPKDSICVEHALEVVPKGKPPCTQDFFKAFCNTSPNTQEALLKINSACTNCDKALVECTFTACKAELDALAEANQNLGCKGDEDCLKKKAPELFNSLGKCLNTSILDSKGACYFNAQACWENPAVRLCSQL